MPAERRRAESPRRVQHHPPAVVEPDDPPERGEAPWAIGDCWKHCATDPELPKQWQVVLLLLGADVRLHQGHGVGILATVEEHSLLRDEPHEIAALVVRVVQRRLAGPD